MKNIDKNVFGSKKLQKQIAKKCKICGEPRYELLDTHRINEGADGGKYEPRNVVIICATCHRLQQAGKIVIEGWYESTGGRLLRWFDEKGEEHFS
jgi:hypothetical protein